MTRTPQVFIRCLAVAAISTLLLAGCATTAGGMPTDHSASPSSSATPSSSANADEFVYSGIEGLTALEALQKTAKDVHVTGTGANAFVVGINGRTADTGKHEFWALYVNGTFSDVGAGALPTHTGDKLRWVIQTY